MPRYKTVKDARLALWERVLEEYDQLVRDGKVPWDLCDGDGQDEEFMRIAMVNIRFNLQRHALLA